MYNTDVALADRLSQTQESGHVRFEYEKETFYIVYGERDADPEEQYRGKGRTLGEAIENLIEDLRKEAYDEYNASS